MKNFTTGYMVAARFVAGNSIL